MRPRRFSRTKCGWFFRRTGGQLLEFPGLHPWVFEVGTDCCSVHCCRSVMKSTRSNRLRRFIRDYLMDSAKTSRSGIKMSCGVVVETIKRGQSIQYVRGHQMICNHVVLQKKLRGSGGGAGAKYCLTIVSRSQLFSKNLEGTPWVFGKWNKTWSPSPRAEPRKPIR
jgi:hypothetical protein